jgi:hypothetical protein
VRLRGRQERADEGPGEREEEHDAQVDRHRLSSR